MKLRLRKEVVVFSELIVKESLKKSFDRLPSAGSGRTVTGRTMNGTNLYKVSLNIHKQHRNSVSQNKITKGKNNTFTDPVRKKFPENVTDNRYVPYD